MSGLNRKTLDSSISFGAQIKEKILLRGSFSIKEITGLDLEKLSKNATKDKVLNFIKKVLRKT